MSDTARTFNGQQPISADNLSTSRMSTKVKRFRDTQLAYDEFRREYSVIIDTASKGIVDIVPQFSAPVHVPLQYCTIPPRMAWRLDIDWKRYVADLKRGEAEWTARLAKIMKDLYREKAEGMPPTDQALTLVGVKPQEWRIVALAAMGDAWALGFQTERTARVVKLIGAAPWVPKTGTTVEHDDVGNAFGLDDQMLDLLGDDGDTLVPRGYADERERVPRRMPVATKVVAAPVADDEPVDFDDDEDDEELGEDAMARAAAELGDEPMLVPPTAKPKNSRART